METGRSTSHTDVMGEEFGELKQEFAEKVRKQGNENLANVIEQSTPSQITRDGFIDGQKTAFPECTDILDQFEQEVKQLQSEGEEAYDHTDYFQDTENGTRFVANWLAQEIESEYEFRHLEDSGQLFVFQDGYFQDRGRELIREECNRRLGDEISRRRVKEVTGIIEDRAYTERYNFRPPARMINFENGVYDLEEEKLKSHDPSYNFAYKVPIKYPEKPPNADKINNFLSTIVETGEEVKTLREIAGYLLLPDYPINKAFILVGQGNNGKSRYIDLLKNLIGDENYANKSLHELEENRFASQKLYGKLACFDDDLPSDKIHHSNKIKKLTGGSDVGAEVKYGGQFDFKNYANLVFATNEMPQTLDNSDGFFRRWLIIDFPYKFKSDPDPENEYHKQAIPKKELMDAITDEEQLQGFVWEVVEDLKDILANDAFTYALSPDEIRKKWREYSVPMVRFIEKYVKQGTTFSEAETKGSAQDGIAAYSYDYVRKDTLHEMIGAYCEQKSHSKPSKKAIKRALDQTDLLYGIKRTRNEPEDKQVPVYSGLRLEVDRELLEGVQGCRVIVEQHTQAHACACVDCSEQSVHIRTGGSETEDESLADNNTSDIDEYEQEAQVIKAVLHDRDSGMLVQDLIDSLPFSEAKVEAVLNWMKQQGIVFEPQQDRVALV